MHRKQIRRWHKLLSASASVIAILGGVVMAPASANNAPMVDMFWADVSRTNQSTATFYLMTNSAIKNFESSDLITIGSATGCKIEGPFSPASFHVITVTGCSDGTVAVQLGANSVSDLSGNWGPAMGAVSDFTVIDRTAPVFTFEPAPSTVADGSFVLTASIDERADLIGRTMEPTLSGEGCYFAGITYATQSITFAITGCKPAAEVSVTILAKSFADQIGNYGPGVALVSPVVSVKSAVQASPAPTPTATPTPASSPMPTATPTASPTPLPTPEATLAVVPPVEPPSPPPAEQPAAMPEPVFEAEQVVPFASMTSINAIEASFVIEPVAPRQPRSNTAVTLTEPLPQPKTEVKIEPVPQAASKTIAPATNLSWVMPAASVVSAALGAVAGALIVRSRLRRNPRLRIA
ncbi:MAG: hypothetical protein ACOVN6_03940 [Rhodoluna sp.]